MSRLLRVIGIDFTRGRSLTISSYGAAVAPPAGTWILTTGFWVDTGEWIDSDSWID